MSIFNVVLKVAFFQNILWCSSDPQTLEKITVFEFGVNFKFYCHFLFTCILFWVNLRTVYFLTNQEALFRKWFHTKVWGYIISFEKKTLKLIKVKSYFFIRKKWNLNWSCFTDNFMIPFLRRNGTKFLFWILVPFTKGSDFKYCTLQFAKRKNGKKKKKNLQPSWFNGTAW